MDRRYKEMRFYNGTPVSKKSGDAAEKLLRGYKSNINRVRRKSNYGSATGGTSSISGSSGLQVIKDRQKRIGDLRKVFNEQGSGRFGARKEQWIAKQYDPEERQKLLDRQSGLESEDPLDPSSSSST